MCVGVPGGEWRSGLSGVGIESRVSSSSLCGVGVEDRVECSDRGGGNGGNNDGAVIYPGGLGGHVRLFENCGGGGSSSVPNTIWIES